MSDWYDEEAERLAWLINPGGKPLCNRVHHPGITCICGVTPPTMEEALERAIQRLKKVMDGGALPRTLTRG